MTGVTVGLYGLSIMIISFSLHLFHFPPACNKGHHGPVRSLAFTPSFDNYASGSEDGTIRIWSWAGIEEQMANIKLNGSKEQNERAVEKK